MRREVMMRLNVHHLSGMMGKRIISLEQPR